MKIQNYEHGNQIRVATPTTPLDRGAPKKQSPISQFSMKIIRRTHLYAGLFLAPWVAMYGFSGFIFNHGSWFAPGGRDKPIEWTVDVTALPQWPEPDDLARKVVAALNTAEKDKAGAAEYRLSASPEGAPKLQGDVSLEGQDEAGGSVRLSFDRQERKGTTFHSPPGPPEEQVKLETNDAELLNATKDAILAAAGKADQKLSATKWTGDGDFPRLSFFVAHGKERRVATYDLRSGLVSFSPAPGSMRVPNFLTSLHVSHGYPADKKSEMMRTVRAVFVDAMALLMCFWAFSGIVMWMQLKQLRRPGLVVAIASLLATVFVWSAMYRFFTGE